MLPGLTPPVSLRRLLDAFAGGFTRPTFVVFTVMVVGMIAQTGSKTVCGMLAGAGLARTWSHDRAHRFFARAVWSIDAVGMVVLDLVVTHLMGTDAVIVLAVDDTAHRRRGKKVHAASWIHDGSAPSRNKLAFGHRWVVVGVVVALPFMTRPVCLPVACRRWRGKGTASTVDLSCQMVATIAAHLPGRGIHVVADAAYHGKQVPGLPGQGAAVATEAFGWPRVIGCQGAQGGQGRNSGGDQAEGGEDVGRVGVPGEGSVSLGARGSADQRWRPRKRRAAGSG